MTTSDENPTSEPVNEAAPVVPAQPAPSPAPYAAPTAPPQAYVAPNPYPHTWMNIVSFVTGLLGFGLIPVIFGHMGVNRANKGTADFKWMGIVGLILGYLVIVGVFIFFAILIGAAIASSGSSY
jgi:hypothetical protein